MEHERDRPPVLVVQAVRPNATVPYLRAGRYPMHGLDLDALEARLLRHMRSGGVDELRALITRLRAAESQSSWNFDLDAAPLGDERMLVLLREPMDNPWKICVVVARFDPTSGFWLTDSGRRIDPPLAWQHLPAAQETPCLNRPPQSAQ